MPTQKMTLTNTLSRFIYALCAVVVISSISNVCMGQILQRPLRWLGEGYSSGYHRCNPGPNSDYYNPYTAHNSMLISRLPQFQGQNYEAFNMSNLQSRPVYRGVPFSVYAAPTNMHSQSYGQFNGYNQTNDYSQTIDGSFEPYKPTQEDLDDAKAAEEYDAAEEKMSDDLEEDLDDFDKDMTDDYDDMLDDIDSDKMKTTKGTDGDSVFRYTPAQSSPNNAGLSKTAYPKETPATPTTQSGLFNPFEDN